MTCNGTVVISKSWSTCHQTSPENMKSLWNRMPNLWWSKKFVESWVRQNIHYAHAILFTEVLLRKGSGSSQCYSREVDVNTWVPFCRCQNTLSKDVGSKCHWLLFACGSQVPPNTDVSSGNPFVSHTHDFSFVINARLELNIVTRATLVADPIPTISWTCLHYHIQGGTLWTASCRGSHGNR